MTTASNTSPETARSGDTDGTARKAFVPPRLRTHDSVQKRTATVYIFS
ncbi:MAG: hypothetical protein GVY12_16430 [Bacteroidetes bacterium]|jgi:hypothetical protein|nr:hypothetical protein [Bacteroidota bacterium]